MANKRHKTDPEFYTRTLSDVSSMQRAYLEETLDDLYSELAASEGVAALRLRERIELIETALAWQGAHPKELPFKELRDVIRSPVADTPVGHKYRKRISSRATAIRAYCVMCMGEEVAGVSACQSFTCPLHPFRMGKDPFRGWELPKADVTPDDCDEAELFEDGGVDGD